MRKKVLLVIATLIILGLAFFHEGIMDAVRIEPPVEEIKFEKAKWNIKKGWGFAHRNEMLSDLMSDPEIRKLKKEAILELLGAPSRTNENYVYYLIDQKRAIVLPMHTKFLVIKFKPDDSIEWMKIHE